MNLSDQRIKKNDTSVFSNKTYKENFPDGIEYHYWNVARFKIINQLIKKIAITIKGISIGCGIGVDVKLLRDYDIDVIGVEPSNVKPIETIKKYIKTNSSSLLVDNYNTVFLLEVLEHLKEPNKMLDDIIKSYTNLQYIIITVPARSEIFSNYDIEVGHEKRYNLEDIECLAKALGIEVVFNKYIFNILYLFTFIWLMIFKKRPTIMKAPKVHMRKLHNILGSIIALENKLFPSLLYGSSIISILRVNCKK